MDTKIAGSIAVVYSETPLITDGQSALDLIASIGWENGVTRIAVNKTAVSEDFFRLSTGVAGEIMQKFVNYGCQLAIIGDFSQDTSAPFRDYMRECNNGKQLFFVSDEEEAVERLT